MSIMKKLMLMTGFILAGIAGFSQTSTDLPGKPSRFSIGPSVGFGHSYMLPYRTAGFYPSWSAGITAIYGPLEWWGVGGDIRYSVEGTKTKMGESGERETQLQYIRVPLKAMVFFGNYEDDFRPKLTLGPSFGFLVGESDTYDAKANSFDAGINASAGFNYRVRTGMWLNVDANYYQGLTDVRQHSGQRELNGNIGLNLGLAFGL